MRRVVTLLALACVSVASGCSFLVESGGLAGDNDGGAGGNDDGSSALSTDADGTDAAGGNDAAAAADGAALGDGSVASDAQTADARDTGPPPPFCQRVTATFCDDFEHNTLVPPWTNVNSGGSATASIQSGLSSSATRAMLSTLGPDAGTCSYAQVEKSISGSFTAFHVMASVYVEARQGHSTLMAPYIGVPNDRCYVYVYDNNGKVDVYVQHAQGTTTVDENTVQGLLDLPGGRWVKLELDYDFSTGALSISVDGDDKIRSLPLSCSVAPSGASMQLGFSCDGAPTATRKTRFDDVAFTPR